MKLEHWHALLATHREVRELLDRMLPTPASGAERTLVRVGPEAIRLLEQHLHEAVNALRKALAGDFRAEQVDEVLHPYIFLLDELLLRRLCTDEQSLWPLLQQRLFGQDSGGDLFFELADARLDQADTPPIYFEVLYFCLLCGFQGQYEDSAAKLHEYKERLKARIPRPPPPGAPTAPPEVEMLPIYDFPIRYYMVTGLVVVLLPVVLWWISNT
jgi:type VI secretion system protein ImpK